MVGLQRVVVVLLVLTLVLSLVSVVFNVMIYKMKSSNLSPVKKVSSSNSGDLGFVVEGVIAESGEKYG